MLLLAFGADQDLFVVNDAAPPRGGAARGILLDSAASVARHAGQSIPGRTDRQTMTPSDARAARQFDWSRACQSSWISLQRRTPSLSIKNVPRIDDPDASWNTP